MSPVFVAGEVFQCRESRHDLCVFRLHCEGVLEHEADLFRILRVAFFQAGEFEKGVYGGVAKSHRVQEYLAPPVGTADLVETPPKKSFLVVVEFFRDVEGSEIRNGSLALARLRIRMGPEGQESLALPRIRFDRPGDHLQCCGVVASRRFGEGQESQGFGVPAALGHAAKQGCSPSDVASGHCPFAFGDQRVRVVGVFVLEGLQPLEL